MGRIDPYKAFQPEITVSQVTLEAKNMQLNPPQTWGDFFRLIKTLSSDRFGPIEHLAWAPSPILDVWHVPWVPLIHTNHTSQKLQSLE